MRDEILIVIEIEPTIVAAVNSQYMTVRGKCLVEIEIEELKEVK